MKLSEFISRLEVVEQEVGDLEVLFGFDKDGELTRVQSFEYGIRDDFFLKIDFGRGKLAKLFFMLW